eukprot:scaffold227_cov71-Skeletonema_menzelii.AAC.8
MNTKFVSPHFDEVEPMQEIEVINSDGYDNITTTCSSTSSPIISSVVTFPPRDDSAESIEKNRQRSDEAMQALLAMVEKERIIPPIDYDHHSPSGNAVNDIDRQKMCEWYYEMADFLKIDRSTASRSMMLLDRFMAASTHSPVAALARQNRDHYQLFALTSLFITIKLFERLNIQAEHVSYLSRGRYEPQEIINMEIVMLAALEWKVSEASKVDYVEIIMEYIIPHMENCSYVMSSGNLLEKIKELALLQIQLSDFEATFASRRQSIVAFAAVCNAFETKKAGMSQSNKEAFYDCIKSVMRIMSLSDSNGRDELGSTIQDLRLTVDPQAAAMSTDAPTDAIYRAHDATSYATEHVEEFASSPIDCALESVESFSMSSFLCCGASTPTTQPPEEFTVLRSNSNSSDDWNDDHHNRCNAFDNFSLTNCCSFDSFTSFESVDLMSSNNKKDTFKPISGGKKKKASTTSRSPTSISMMLGGL